MSVDYVGDRGGRQVCWHFFEDMMMCVKEESIHRQLFKCRSQREDYMECMNHKKKYAKLTTIKQQKEKLIKEGKWPIQQ